MPSAKLAWKLGQLLGYFIKILLHIFMYFTVGHFPIYFIPIYLTFFIFSSVFKTSQNMKPNSTWEGACWLVVGGSWQVTLSLYENT